MGRRHVVRDLDDEQFTFVIEGIIHGLTDRELSAAFEKQFDQKLAKSSLNRWRESAGNELAERYRLTRYQARQLLTDLQAEDADRFQVVIGNIEERLLTATREVISSDPVKLLRIRLDEEKRRLKERELRLKERQLDLEIEKARRAKLDLARLPEQIAEDLLDFIGDDPAGLKWFTGKAKALIEYLGKKYASDEAQDQ
jgi:hypothetical protein